ncbi:MULTISPECIES: mycothiol conjugate amidase Mca [Nocardiopsis]|uniref:Mycothiol S-conjugate amidase n=1 Tax=Nocardiopsis dassonvillei (strain ATCC 23218 / DSM 43111 / CIP 107115 / JCM 7437 / KCTC 9190 / NBRC 14626 / NCTC 10488 / NRRL B-5397 / IMRU 509) TaxID=446468 RepID=D7B6Z3_NOCDD|nr:MULTISPECIES: mycothiol conjugate amidase Mca [Nocardiopsis]ADH65547.1 mycothiol conjugate amidase Mca [Nocardiopsis dassonvillei subsp. dassonvillei DSM 43111]APC33911.1 mycothiol conjugate amidase Mca [Nocardiopsis dassonvillei]NKY79454.1 mycothiol conjugate amidase Mca [Nocardiopsis dassonvillei]VEI91566.1 1D-myo-inositol 2-acetamido-2-deoxy-alpha-D-glucopyranoside deacetylase [Nocardiopsis dassonvillei]
MSERLRLMAVHAHPDDESSKGAATMARYVEEGVDVLVVTMTGGERGDILNPAMERPDIRENIAQVRREEMERAREILGVQQEFAGFVDSGLPEGDPLPPLPEGCFATLPVEEGAAPLVESIRRFRPHVILTYDENGGYPHPDHIMTHKVTMHAFDTAGDPDAYPDAGDPWQPLKLYYFVSFPPERFEALADVLAARGLENPFEEWMKRIADRDHPRWEITTRVHCSEYFDVADEALKAHATQVDPNGFWFAVPNEVVAEAWPSEDYHLVRSLVDTEIPEKDLFAGVREAVRV